MSPPPGGNIALRLITIQFINLTHALSPFRAETATLQRVAKSNPATTWSLSESRQAHPKTSFRMGDLKRSYDKCLPIYHRFD